MLILLGPDIDPATIADDLQRGHHRVVVMQWFAHPHEHQIAQRRVTTGAKHALQMQHLPTISPGRKCRTKPI
jgi:hypothetical protein